MDSPVPRGHTPRTSSYSNHPSQRPPLPSLSHPTGSPRSYPAEVTDRHSRRDNRDWDRERRGRQIQEYRAPPHQIFAAHAQSPPIPVLALVLVLLAITVHLNHPQGTHTSRFQAGLTLLPGPRLNLLRLIPPLNLSLNLTHRGGMIPGTTAGIPERTKKSRSDGYSPRSSQSPSITPQFSGERTKHRSSRDVYGYHGWSRSQKSWLVSKFFWCNQQRRQRKHSQSLFTVATMGLNLVCPRAGSMAPLMDSEPSTPFLPHLVLTAIAASATSPTPAAPHFGSQ